ncbi:MAG: site-2 protease family protein [Chloroflexota bacterium]|nr:site-2 protease family protein [Chloroflexota bacterium]
MRSTIHLCKLFGIPVGINASWFLVIFLITFLLQSQFHMEFPRWSTGQTWTLAGITGLLFFGSVLAHELAHSLVATIRGIPVHGITLFVFGGISNMAQEARHPWVEFVIAIAGPLLSIILGGVLVGVAYLTFSWNNPVYIVALNVGWANLALGIFNLMPGFPLDGGRVLLAIIWGTTGNYQLAITIVTRIGQGLAILFIAGSVAWFLKSGEVVHLWMLLIGLFLFSAASSGRTESQQARDHNLRLH